MYSFPPESLSWKPKENKIDFYNKAKKVLNSYKFAQYGMQIMKLMNSAFFSAHKVLIGVLMKFILCNIVCVMSLGVFFMSVGLIAH